MSDGEEINTCKRIGGRFMAWFVVPYMMFFLFILPLLTSIFDW